MKRIYVILLSFLLVSCEIYVTECATPTLSGKYKIAKVRKQSVKQNTTEDKTFNSGEFCTTFLPYPFDTFIVDSNLVIHFDYSSISFPQKGQDFGGRDLYEFNVFYKIFNCTPYYVGDLQFDYFYSGNNVRMTFFIEDDGFEHLQLKTKGTWPDGKWGENVVYTFSLTRVGP